MLGGMKIYSDYPLRRAAQIAADLLSLAIIAAGIWLGIVVAAAIAVLAQVGRQLNQAGLGFQGAMTDAGDFLGQTPFVGDAVRVPFDAASGTGVAIAEVGETTEGFIVTTAAIVGAVIAVVVAALVLWIWLRRRITFIRRATEASRLATMGDGHDLLALRALVSASRAELAATSAHPVDAWRSGQPEVVRKLAALELRGAGVRPRVIAAR